LLLDCRRAHRRRLQAVAQRLVVEHRDRAAAGGVRVPVVNERMRFHAHVFTCATSRPRTANLMADNPPAAIASAARLAVHSPRATAGRIQSSMRANGADRATASDAARMYSRPATTIT